MVGLKKSAGAKPPSASTAKRITDSPRPPGGRLPGPGAGEAPAPWPLAVVRKNRPGPSETRPLPDIQTEARWVSEPATVENRVSRRVRVSRPATVPM